MKYVTLENYVVKKQTLISQTVTKEKYNVDRIILDTCIHQFPDQVKIPVSLDRDSSGKDKYYT